MSECFFLLSACYCELKYIISGQISQWLSVSSYDPFIYLNHATGSYWQKPNVMPLFVRPFLQFGKLDAVVI